MASRREFMQALGDLADNAFKFCPKHGKVEFLVRSSENGGATICIQDESPGVPAELREKVFEHFYESGGSDCREDQGSGIGFTITRAVFSSLEGDVRIVDGPSECMMEVFLPDPRSEDIAVE